MRFVLFFSIAAFAIAGGFGAGAGSNAQEAAALGTPSTLPFHQAIPFVSRDGFVGVASADLEAAEARWANNGGGDYRITVSHGGFGAHERHTIYVHDGLVGDFESECFAGPQAADCGVVDYSRYTLPGLFALLRGKIAEQGPNDGDTPGAPFVRARYHPVFGYPVQFSYGPRFVPDGTTTWLVDDFQLIY